MQTRVNLKNPTAGCNSKWIARRDQCCFSRKSTNVRVYIRRNAGMLTKGAENKAEAIALHVAGNSFRPLKRAFLPACFSPSSTRLDAARGIEIYTKKTRRAIRTPWRDVDPEIHSQRLILAIHPRQEPKWNFVPPGVLPLLLLHPEAFQSILTGRLCGESR